MGMNEIAWRRSQSFISYGPASAVHLSEDGVQTLCGVSIPRHAQPSFKAQGHWINQQAIALDVNDRDDFEEVDGSNSYRKCKRCARKVTS